MRRIKNWIEVLKTDRLNTTKRRIYIIQEREFGRLNENTYKIGRTDRGIERFTNYPKDSEVFYYEPVKNSKTAELAAKQAFKDAFPQRVQYGVEYFGGDIRDMMRVMDKAIAQHMLSQIPTRGLRFFAAIRKKALPTEPKTHKIFNFRKPLPSLPSLPSPPSPPRPSKTITTYQTTSAYSCVRCGKTFDRSFNLAQHYKKKNPCDLRQNHNKSSDKKPQPSAIPQIPRGYECGLCGKIFDRSFNLAQHYKKKTPCDLRCVKCNINLKTVAKYKKHCSLMH